MYRSFLLTTISIGAAVILAPQMAVAKSANEVREIARQVFVEIRLKNNQTLGSGIIISQQGNLYTLVTNRHVICGSSNCNQVSDSEVYTLSLTDGQTYKV
jgi:S1-C subfamily serine protease